MSFLLHGKIVLTDTPLGLTKRVGKTKLVLTFEGEKQIVQKYLESVGAEFTFVRPALVEIMLAEEAVPKVLLGLKEQGIWITSLATEQPSLEDVFLHVSQEKVL